MITNYIMGLRLKIRYNQLIIIACSLLIINNVTSQNTGTPTVQPILKSSPSSPYYEPSNTLSEYDNTRIILQDNDITTGSAFQINAKRELFGISSDIGSLEFFTIKSDHNYGIYQTSNESSGLINYFQDPLKIGSQLFGRADDGTPGISMIPSPSVFTFSIDLHSGDQPLILRPLIINNEGITVWPKLTTYQFKMQLNSGTGKILMSDADGNGNWTDASNFHDDDWLIGPPSDGNKDGGNPPPSEERYLYLNPSYLKVGIGITNPQSALAVNGKVTAKEFEATLDGFPDYVLKDDYKLRSLKEVEEYIQTNGHLPEVPFEKEVVKQGLNLGEMNVLLLKKVEELTLYIISMKKEIDELKADKTAK